MASVSTDPVMQQGETTSTPNPLYTPLPLSTPPRPSSSVPLISPLPEPPFHASEFYAPSCPHPFAGSQVQPQAQPAVGSGPSEGRYPRLEFPVEEAGLDPTPAGGGPRQPAGHDADDPGRVVREHEHAHSHEHDQHHPHDHDEYEDEPCCTCFCVKMVCHMFCCPPVPSIIVAKQAFLPPEPASYSFEKAGATDELSLCLGGRGVHLPPGLNITMTCVLLPTKSGNVVAAYLLKVPTPRYTILFSHGNAVDIGQMLPFMIHLVRGLAWACPPRPPRAHIPSLYSRMRL